MIPNPDKIICVGLNYKNHRKETGRAEVEYPTMFAPVRQQPDRAPRQHHPAGGVDRSTGRANWPSIIGKAGRDIPKDKAYEPRRRLHLLQRRQRARVAAPQPTSSPRARTSEHRRVRSLHGDRRRGGRSRPLRLETRLNGEVVQDSHHRPDDLRHPAPDRIRSAFTRLSRATSSPRARRAASARAVTRRCG